MKKGYFVPHSRTTGPMRLTFHKYLLPQQRGRVKLEKRNPPSVKPGGLRKSRPCEGNKISTGTDLRYQCGYAVQESSPWKNCCFGSPNERCRACTCADLGKRNRQETFASPCFSRRLVAAWSAPRKRGVHWAARSGLLIVLRLSQFIFDRVTQKTEDRKNYASLAI